MKEMKLLGNLEVSGLDRVVFYETGEAWVRSEPGLDEDPLWFLESDFESTRIKTHDGMMSIIKTRLDDPSWRIWIHGETMNIVPVDKSKIHENLVFTVEY